MKPALFVVAIACCATAFFASATAADVVEPVDLLHEQAATIDSAPSEAELEDLAYAADEHDLSMDEAIAQYGWRDNFALLVDEVSADLPDHFARAEIANERTAWIAFAGPQPKAARERIASFRAAFPHVSIETRPNVGYNAKEMNEAVIAVHQRVMSRPGVVDAVTEFRASENAISVLASTERGRRGPKIDLDDIRPATLPALSRLPESVKVRVSTVASGKITTDASWSYHHGGERIYSGTKFCTTGFGTRASSNTSGTRGVSTAGHCGNSMKDDGRTMTFKSQYDGWRGDFQWHTGPGFESDNFFAGSSVTTETKERDVAWVGWVYPGNYLCKNGAASHKSCDDVYNTGVCTGENCNMILMVHRRVEDGDSGGPVFYSNGARAVIEGTAVVNGAFRDTYSQAGNMPVSIGVYVATS